MILSIMLTGFVLLAFAGFYFARSENRDRKKLIESLRFRHKQSEILEQQLRERADALKREAQEFTRVYEEYEAPTSALVGYRGTYR